MKALALLLLALALGAAVLVLVLDSGRSERGARPSAAPLTRPSDPAPAGRLRPSGPEPAEGAGQMVEPKRQSVESGPAAEVRAILEGAVIGEGVPIPGASVELLRDDLPLAVVLTDARGRFKLESEPLASAGTLRVVARGFVPTERNLAPRPAGGTVMLGNLRLLRGQLLAGRVLDAQGRGIADAELRAEPLNAGGDLLVSRGRSGPDGRFEVSDAPPGTVLVSARARGFGEQSVQHTPGSKELEILLQPGSELRLLLRTARGLPVVGADVTIQVSSDGRGAKRSAKSDEQGRVHFEGLGARSWTVRVTHPEYRPNGRGQVQATGAEEILECQPWPAIEGVVHAPLGARPPPGTRAQALPASAPSDRIADNGGGVEVGADGRFRLAGLRPGDWRVRVTAPGFAAATSGTVKLGIEGDGYTGTIELQSGGKLALLLALEARPVAGAEIELFPSPPTPAQLWALASSRGLGIGRRTPSGPDGRAVLENLSAGTVWVAVYAEGCPPTLSGPHAVSADPSPAPITVELARGARIHGRVLKETGAPVAGAQLRIVERGGRLGFPLTLASAENGRYTSAWLPPGSYTIEAFAPEDPSLRSGPEELEILAGEQRALDLTL